LRVLKQVQEWSRKWKRHHEELQFCHLSPAPGLSGVGLGLGVPCGGGPLGLGRVPGVNLPVPGVSDYKSRLVMVE